MSKRIRKQHYSSSEDELDDSPDVLVSRIETAQRQYSETEPHDTKEENSRDLEEFSKMSSNTNSTSLEDRDELSSSEGTGEMIELNEDDGIKSQEDDQPIIIKRKRGRPHKYPAEIGLKTKEDSKAETGIATVEQSPPSSQLKISQADESNKETSNIQEKSTSNGDSEEKIASMRRRGRKSKRSLTSSDDAESSEPERKRQKSVSETSEDKKDQESDEEEEEEEDEPLGATTRSTTRSEAQRKHHSKPSTRATSKLGIPETVSPRNHQKLAKEKLPTSQKVSKSPPLGRSKVQLSPSIKCKREVSPPGAGTRGQQRVDEAPLKKAKRVICGQHWKGEVQCQEYSVICGQHWEGEVQCQEYSVICGQHWKGEVQCQEYSVICGQHWKGEVQCQEYSVICGQHWKGEVQCQEYSVICGQHWEGEVQCQEYCVICGQHWKGEVQYQESSVICGQHWKGEVQCQEYSVICGYVRLRVV
ncbi:Biorientation of chromosomes in cell division protein 1-like 1 [Lemmus lemmus]